MKFLRNIIRIIAGSVFVFSGIVKAIDPLGSAFKFHDYFQAMRLDFLQPLALTLAVILCLAEFISGFSVLTGIRYREGIWGIIILILFFTPLTFYLALTNPVSDCGCFGDTVHLTNWQTFGKNIILFALIVYLFLARKSSVERFSLAAGWSIIGTAIIIFVCFALFNLRYLPVIDFLPYRIGNNIPEKMKIPAGAAPTRYKTTFIYKKDGKQKEFTLENYPANDSSWIFVNQKSEVSEKGYEPPVHDFSIVTLDGHNITDTVLNNQQLTLLMISRKFNLAKQERLNSGFEAGKKCLAEGIDFYILSATGSEELKSFDSLGLTICHTDETTLKTMVRSNPGYILLQNGTVKGKWSWANLPDNFEKMKSAK